LFLVKKNRIIAKIAKIFIFLLKIEFSLLTHKLNLKIVTYSDKKDTKKVLFFNIYWLLQINGRYVGVFHF
jgi:hypothetical protein